METLIGIKDWILANWIIIIAIVGAISFLCKGIADWMEKNEYKCDDGIAKVLRYIGSLAEVVLSLLKSIFSPIKNKGGYVVVPFRKLPLVFMILCLLFMFVGFLGCGNSNKTITQQIMSQTDDINTIALATYADALQLYVDAQQLYLPYKEVFEINHPETHKVIIDNFTKAWEVLRKWKAVKVLPPTDIQDFRAYLREISLELARQLE